MLLEVNQLNKLTVNADDGALGTVEDVYFDDRQWVIRYMVIAAGSGLSGRNVLISPISVSAIDWTDKTAQVKLTRTQVMSSPGIDTDKPVSRQHEIDYYNYYGYANYWDGTGLSALAMYPIPWVGAAPDSAFVPGRVPDDVIAREREELLDIERESATSHLRSSREVMEYQIMARDGPIGSVENLLFDDQTWAIRYMVVDTRNWLPGKHVLISPDWVEQVSWSEREVVVNVTRKAVETSPQYDGSGHLSRTREADLYRHHDRPGYWF